MQPDAPPTQAGTHTTEQLQNWRAQLDCGFPQINAVFADCMLDADARLDAEGLDNYLTQARFLGKWAAAQSQC